MYALIRTGGKQYRVAPGETVRVERLTGKVGSNVTFGDVLAVHTDDEKLLTGAAAARARVTGKIVAHGRNRKVLVMKFKRTNQYKITRGHRQNFTSVRVNEIQLKQE
jgi:large subunit ribosomal protein L21